MTTFPQYAKTSHSDVIAAIETINQQYRDFIEQCRFLSDGIVGHPDAARIHGWKLDGFHVTGLDAREVRKVGITEGWIKPTAQGYTRPKKSSPDYEKFDISYRAALIPGRHRDKYNIIGGDGWIGVGACFIHDGFVYSGFSNRPTDHIEGIEEYGWTEILASEYDSAAKSHGGN